MQSDQQGPDNGTAVAGYDANLHVRIGEAPVSDTTVISHSNARLAPRPIASPFRTTLPVAHSSFLDSADTLAPVIGPRERGFFFCLGAAGGGLSPAMALMSPPAQNARPAPVRRIALHQGVRAESEPYSFQFVMQTIVNGVQRLGTLIVIVATLSTTSTLRNS